MFNLAQRIDSLQDKLNTSKGILSEVQTERGNMLSQVTD